MSKVWSGGKEYTAVQNGNEVTLLSVSTASTPRSNPKLSVVVCDGTYGVDFGDDCMSWNFASQEEAKKFAEALQPLLDAHLAAAREAGRREERTRTDSMVAISTSSHEGWHQTPEQYLTNHDKVTFDEFAWICARSSFDLQPCEDRVNRAKDLFNKAVVSLQSALEVTPEQAQKDADGFNQKELEEFQRELSEKTALRERCESLLQKANRWIPPNDNYIPLRTFMTTQLLKVISERCFPIPDMPPKITAEEYLGMIISGSKKNIESYSNLYEKEMEAAKIRYMRMVVLRQSIGDPK